MISRKTRRTICEQSSLARLVSYVAKRILTLAVVLMVAAIAAISQSGESEAPTFGATGAATLSSGSQSVYAGSVPEGQATGAVLPLSFKEAIDRALRNNRSDLRGRAGRQVQRP